MKSYAFIFGVVATFAVVINAHQSGPLVTTLAPQLPKQRLPIVDNVLVGVGEMLAGVGRGLYGTRVAPAPTYYPWYFNNGYTGIPNGFIPGAANGFVPGQGAAGLWPGSGPSGFFVPNNGQNVPLKPPSPGDNNQNEGSGGGCRMIYRSGGTVEC